MIHDRQNSKYLTNAQWLKLMEIVNEDKELNLHMPMGENCPLDITYDGKHYVINADGSLGDT